MNKKGEYEANAFCMHDIMRDFVSGGSQCGSDTSDFKNQTGESIYRCSEEQIHTDENKNGQTKTCGK
jgi:hypothetical protein